MPVTLRSTLCKSMREGDELHCRIKGLDKKNIAKTVYRMLPQKVGDFDLSLVKKVVTQERFKTLVQNAFDGFDRFL